MANEIWAGVRLARLSWRSCYQPVIFRGAGPIGGIPSRVSSVFRFVSSVAANPGVYSYLIGIGGSNYTVTMTIGAGGVITNVSVPDNIPPTAGGGVLSGIGTLGATLSRPLVAHLPSVTMGIDRSCWNLYYDGWTQQEVTDNVIFGDKEVPIAQFISGTNGGMCIPSPGQLTTKAYKATGSYQADWVGGGEPPPGDHDGMVVYSFYPGDAAGNPIIPEEDLVDVPTNIINGGNTTALVCFDSTTGTICTEVDPFGDTPFTWPTYNGNPTTVTVTYPECPLCEPITIPPPNWNPDDPDDPTNCTPAPGVTCPIFTLYIPPPRTIPDPNPEPEPEPGPTDGNEGNYQGCIPNLCTIPFILNFRSKP